MEIPSGVYAATINISTAEQLRNLATEVNSGTSHQGDTINLTADINLGGTEFTPIGNGSIYAFKGTFNGNNHTISGLNMSRGDASYNGLFGYVASFGTIKNLNVSGTVAGGYYTGGIVGYNCGTIQYCSSSCTVTGSTSDVGGIAGRNDGGSITYCHNTGNVSGGNQGTGGIVGELQGATISNCYNTGTITGVKETGGIVGRGRGSVNMCYNKGSVTSGGSFVGGIVGEVAQSTTISKCFNEGALRGSNYVAGICYAAAGGNTISNVYNTGNITATSMGSPYIAGIMILDAGVTPVSNVYNAGTLTYSTGASNVYELYCASNYNAYIDLSNGYYLEGTGGNAQGTAVSQATLRSTSMVTNLNASQSDSPWSSAASQSVNNGYPVLIFEAGSTTDISNVTVSTISAQAYIGAQITPHPTVTNNASTLTEGTHYTLSWTNNTNPGTGTVTVTGITSAGYAGTKSVNFTINKRALTITAKDQAVDGNVGISTGTGQVTVGGSRTWF